jgi:hypothetical protein
MPLPSSRLGWLLRQVTSTLPATRAGIVNAKYACRTEQNVASRPRPVQRSGTCVPHVETGPGMLPGHGGVVGQPAGGFGELRDQVQNG